MQEWLSGKGIELTQSHPKPLFSFFPGHEVVCLTVAYSFHSQPHWVGLGHRVKGHIKGQCQGTEVERLAWDGFATVTAERWKKLMCRRKSKTTTGLVMACINNRCSGLLLILERVTPRVICPEDGVTLTSDTPLDFLCPNMAFFRATFSGFFKATLTSFFKAT